MKYTIGIKIKRFREAKNMKQAELAKALGVTGNAISNWEQGIARPSADQLVILCQVLGVSADELLGMERQVITKADEELIAAYHRAPLDVQQAVATLLNRYNGIKMGFRVHFSCAVIRQMWHSACQTRRTRGQKRPHKI